MTFSTSFKFMTPFTVLLLTYPSVLNNCQLPCIWCRALQLRSLIGSLIFISTFPEWFRRTDEEYNILILWWFSCALSLFQHDNLQPSTHFYEIRDQFNSSKIIIRICFVQSSSLLRDSDSNFEKTKWSAIVNRASIFSADYSHETRRP